MDLEKELKELGDSDSYFSRVVRDEVEKQRLRDEEHRRRIDASKKELNDVLSELGKPSYEELRTGVSPRRLRDTSVLCYALEEAAEVLNEGDLKHQMRKGATVFGLVSPEHPAFSTAKVYAKVPLAKSPLDELRLEMGALQNKIRHLEGESTKRRVEVCLLKRILMEVTKDGSTLSEQHREVLEVLGEVGDNLEEPAEATPEAVTLRVLAREGPASLLKAVYAQPSILQGTRPLPPI